MSRAPLRLVTYLAPSIPLELYEAVARHLAAALALPVTLRADTSISSPPPGVPDPFSLGDADVGFLCNPGYRWLAAIDAVTLVGAAPVFADPRAAGRPVFYDTCSLSGYECMGSALALFGARIATGSHPASIAQVAAGTVEAAAIDSNVLAVELARDPTLDQRIRVLTTLGPHAIQPVVARARLPGSLLADLTAALLAMHRGAEASALAACRVLRFAAVAPADYGVVEGCAARVA